MIAKDIISFALDVVENIGSVSGLTSTMAIL